MTCRPSSKDLITDVKRRQRLEKELTEIGWCYWMISQHPFLVIFLCLLVVTTFTAVAFVFTDHPDFGEPSKGFEVRGNYLSDKLVTWHNLINQTGYTLLLSNYPYNYFKRKTDAAQVFQKKSRFLRSADSNYNLKYNLEDYFCDYPRSNYASWSFKLKDRRMMSLLSHTALLSMCKAEEEITQSEFFSNVCIRNSSNACCRMMSLPNYIAFLAGSDSCLDITAEGLDHVHSLLVHCAKFYCDKQLKPDCWNSNTNSHLSCFNVPMQCKYYNVVYSIFHYFLEKSILCPFSSNFTHYVSAFLPVFKHKDGLVPLFYEKFNHQISDVITIYSVDFGINDQVFDDYLFTDAVYPISAMAGVGLILLFYTGSLFVTLMSFVSTINAMLSAYFFYRVLFNFKFFPFMNLAALLVMIGMSADCVLIFFSAWSDSVESYSSLKRDRSSQISLITKATMKRVTWSIFVTSSTTAAAFFASYSSEVTAIKCFGVYTGLTVLSNFFLSLSWLPATAVIHHQYLANIYHRCNSHVKSLLLVRCYMRLYQYTVDYLRVFFDQIQVLIIVRLRYFWIIIMFLLALGGAFVVLVYPTFHLPSGKSYLHYFQPSHPFETNHHQKFSFQNNYESMFVIHFVFGIWPRDTGDIRNPSNTGTLHLQHRFNMSSRQSQIFLYNFCKSMKKFSYYSPSVNEIVSNQSQIDCFIDSFKTWMDSRACVGKQLCCARQFPYQPATFEHCLKEAIFQLSRTPGIHLQRNSPGPRYDQNDVIRAVLVSLHTNLSHAASFEEVRKFYDTAEHYFESELKRAPPDIADGWLVSELDFFALQKGLYDGSIASVGWSLLVGLLVILVTTRSILVSFFASLTIACIIFVTIGSLVLLGWELNILESVTVSIAVGLSVDFAAHYAIAYLQSDSAHDRRQRVEVAVSHVCPAIALAALTTFIAGAGMFPATVLVYSKFGIFLMILMAASWMYSTYFFLPLLTVCGPRNNSCNIRCRQSANRKVVDQSVMMTETSTCSPSASCNYELVECSTVL